MNGFHVLAGADEELLRAEQLTKDALERKVGEGHGQLLSDFRLMHAAIMYLARIGNRQGQHCCKYCAST